MSFEDEDTTQRLRKKIPTIKGESIIKRSLNIIRNVLKEANIMRDRGNE